MTIDVIEAIDGPADEIVRRVPTTGSGEFVLGAQVIVRESQTAVFFRDGKCYDTLGPGRHTLSTLNIPLIGKAVTDRVFGESPFKAEVYFVNERAYLGVKWGTRDPIVYRDTELAMVRLRAHGQLAFRITDPVLFLNTVVGVRGTYSTKDIEGFLKSLVLSALAQSIGAVLESIFDLPLRYDVLSTTTKARVYDEFASYGAQLLEFTIEAITPPENVQARIDERTSMGAVGDLDKYLRYKSAVALGDAADASGGTGGGSGAMETAVGVGLGLSMVNALQQGLTPTPPQTTAHHQTVSCPNCTHQISTGDQFCSKCGTRVAAATVCGKCERPVASGARFCPNCGSPTG